MPAPVRIDYTAKDSRIGDASLMPYAPAVLRSGVKPIDATGLVDSGASVNVLPFHLGVELGLDWSSQKTPIRLASNVSDSDARAVLNRTVICLEGSTNTT